MADPIELLIQGRAHELGPGFAVRRVLPSVKRRMVGPFIFLDHFGPMVVPPGGDGMEVRPHPHIGLATVTYLFDGGIFHRDSLGYAQAIRPGDVNWMTAGSGIAHSERTEPEMKRTGFRMHGVQTWVALPKSARGDGAVVRACRDGQAAGVEDGGAALRLIVGTLWRPHGADHALLADLLRRRGDAGRRPRSPCRPSMPSARPMSPRAARPSAIACSASATSRCSGAGQPVEALAGPDGAKVMLLGGAPMDGPRHIWWNFVSSSQGAHRAGQGRLARRPLRQGAGRSGVHPAAGKVKLSSRA